MHGSQGPTKFVPGQACLAGAERPMADQHLLERQAAYELHPDTNAPVMFAGSVNRDDIWMTYTSERLSFLQQSGFEMLVLGGSALQKLEGDGPIELRIVGAINGAERTVANFFDQDELAPSSENARVGGGSVLASRAGVRSSCIVRGLWRIAVAFLRFSDHRDETKLFNQAAFLRTGLAFEAGPVDRGSVGNSGGQVSERTLLGSHCSRIALAVTAHLVGQPHDRPGDRHPRGVGAVLPELGGDLFVAEPAVEAQHNRQPFFFSQGRERTFVTFQRFGFNDYVECRPIAIRKIVRIRELCSFRTTTRTLAKIDDPVLDSLLEIGHERVLGSNL